MTNMLEKWKRFATFAAALGLSATAFAAPLGNDGWGLPPDASVDGHRIDWLIHSTMLFVVILFVIMVVWMVLACVRFGPKHQSLYEHGDGKKQIMTAVAISAAIFFIVDGNLFVNSMMDIGDAFWNFERRRSRPACRAHRDQRAPVGLERALRRARRQVQHRRRHRHLERHPRPRGRPDHLRARLHRRDPQLLPAELPHQAGRHARHDQQALVPGQADRRVRHRLRPALRHQPLQDEGPLDRAAQGRVRPLGRPRPRPTRSGLSTRRTPSPTGAGTGSRRGPSRATGRFLRRVWL